MYTPVERVDRTAGPRGRRWLGVGWGGGWGSNARRRCAQLQGRRALSDGAVCAREVFNRCTCSISYAKKKTYVWHRWRRALVAEGTTNRSRFLHISKHNLAIKANVGSGCCDARNATRRFSKLQVERFGDRLVTARLHVGRC